MGKYYIRYCYIDGKSYSETHFETEKERDDAYLQIRQSKSRFIDSGDTLILLDNVLFIEKGVMGNNKENNNGTK